MFLLLSASLLLSCAPVSSPTIEISNEISSNINFSNKYIYINNNNALCLKDIYSDDISILIENVLEFKNSNEYVVFINKDFNHKKLVSYEISTGKLNTIKDYYNDDFLVKNEYLFYIEDTNICKVNLKTNDTEKLVKLTTNDVVLNLVDDNKIIYSHMEGSLPTTFSYDFTTKVTKKLATGSSNIVSMKDVLYGLDSNLNMFKINPDGSSDTIANYPVLKFEIDKDYIVYLDANGSLNTLDSKGNKRVISDSATDFKRIDNNLYYMSSSSENVIYETQLKGRHKKSAVTDSSPMLNINLIK